MTRTTLLRVAGAITLAATVATVGAMAAVAQDSVAPGVVISGGTVSNETGIGLIIDGGAAIGSTIGGDENAAATIAENVAAIIASALE